VQIGGDRTARDLRTSRRRRPCVVRRGRLEDRGRIRTLRERGVVDRRETRLGRSPPACHRCRNLRRLDIRVRHTFLTPRVGPGGFPYGARRDRVPAHSSRSVIEREERTGKGPRPEVGRDYFVTFRLYGSRRAPESNVSLTDCWSFL